MMMIFHSIFLSMIRNQIKITFRRALYLDYQASGKPLELVKNCDLPAIVLEIVILDHFPRMGGGVGADTGRNLKTPPEL